MTYILNQACQDICEESCMKTCELHNQCGSCETCQTTCQLDCQTACQLGCESTCQKSCQLACEKACQYACENYCMTECESCETACQGTCLDACQVCEGVCQTNCEIDCESCQTACQKYCESACQLGCQSGQTPKLPTPTLDTSKTIKTANSISVTINPVTGATTYYAGINGGTIQTSSGRTFIFTGLTPNTQYYIEIKVSGTGYSDSDWAGYYATTLATTAWEWFEPKTTGTEFNVGADEWLAFCSKINEIRIANGLSAYSFTTSPDYIAPGEDYYAWIFLQACNAINQINGQVATELLNVVSDDDIYAWYYDNLKTALNNAIV